MGIPYVAGRATNNSQSFIAGTYQPWTIDAMRVWVKITNPKGESKTAGGDTVGPTSSVVRTTGSFQVFFADEEGYYTVNSTHRYWKASKYYYVALSGKKYFEY